MTDFSKIVNHPEKQLIISKLCSGDTPKVVSAHLKTKYSKPDEGHLRIPAAKLQEFYDVYGPKYGFIKKIVKQDSSKLDKEIAQSLLENSEWRARAADVTDDEINLQKKLNTMLTILEARAEQIFDKIQENPGGTKVDYVFDKIMNTLLLVIDRIDRLQNDRPDIKIEHSYTIQMMEQHTVVMQEVIKKILQQMSPEYTMLFMDLMNEGMKNAQPDDLIAKVPKMNIANEHKKVDLLMDKTIDIDIDEGDDDV